MGSRSDPSSAYVRNFASAVSGKGLKLRTTKKPFEAFRLAHIIEDNFKLLVFPQVFLIARFIQF